MTDIYWEIKQQWHTGSKNRSREKDRNEVGKEGRKWVSKVYRNDLRVVGGVGDDWEISSFYTCIYVFRND